MPTFPFLKVFFSYKKYIWEIITRLILGVEMNVKCKHWYSSHVLNVSCLFLNFGLKLSDKRIYNYAPLNIYMYLIKGCVSANIENFHILNLKEKKVFVIK